MSEVDPGPVREEAPQSALSGGEAEGALASIQGGLCASLALPIPCCLTLDSSHAPSGPQFPPSVIIVALATIDKQFSQMLVDSS